MSSQTETRRSAPASADDTGARRQVGFWLVGIAALLVAMIVVGGLTRLTDSGLSITEWRPVTGAVPPLSDAAWQVEFEKYRKIPEYEQVNKGMSLAEFKTIYWWEWGHRLLGRLIGVAFLLPFLYFLLRRKITPAMMPRLAMLFVLGGAQGALGWFMVMSGLSERVDVSQYRLAAHLGFAFIIFGAVLWTVFDYLRIGSAGAILPDSGSVRRAKTLVWAVIGVLFVQIIAGALVAGLDAGLTYNSWPLMDGRFVPRGLSVMTPVWRNLFENITAVQFVHRMIAYGVFALALWLFLQVRRAGDLSATQARVSAHLVMATVTLQIVLGIGTLLLVVPISLAALHQLGAVGTFAAALYHAHVLMRAPVVAGAGRAPAMVASR